MRYSSFQGILLLGYLLVFSDFAMAQSNVNQSYDSSDWVKSTVSSFADNFIKSATNQRDIKSGLALKEILNDSLSFSNLRKSLISSLKLTDSGLTSISREVISDGYSELNAQTKAILKECLLSTLNSNGLNGLLARLKPSLPVSFFEFRNMSLAISGQTRPSLFDNKQSVYLNSVDINAGIDVAGIPIEATITRQDYFENGYRGQFIFNWNFNRDEYFKNLKQAAYLKVRPEEIGYMGMEALNTIKQRAQSILEQKISSLGEEFRNYLPEKLAKFGLIDNLLNIDISAISQEILSPDALAAQFDRERLLQTLQSQANLGEKIDTSLLQSLKAQVRNFEKLLEFLQMIKSQKQEWEANGFLEKIKGIQADQLQQVGEWMNTPDKLKTLVKNKMNLTGLQKFFLNVNGMSMGRNTVSLSPLSAYGFLNNGVNIEFLNNNNYLFLMAGKQKDFASLSDFYMRAPAFSNDNMAYGVRIGKGAISKNHSHISLFKYQQNRSEYGQSVLRFFPSSSVVATLSNQLQIGAKHMLRTELSKSSRTYNGETAIFDSLSAGTLRGGKLLNTENFFQQIAATLEYEGEVEKWNLSQQVYITYTGSDYSNPGSLFLGRGMKEIGGRLKKTMFGRKLQMSIRGSYREFSYTGTDNKWKSSNLSFSTRLKLKFGQYLSFSYQPNQATRFLDNRRMRTGGSDRLSLEAGFRRRIGRTTYSNTMSLAFLNNDYQLDSLSATNQSVQFSSINSVAIKGNSIFLSITYSRVNNPSNIAFFNTTANAEMGFSYTLGKKFQSSSSLGFSEVHGWYRQVGIRQSFGGQIGKRLYASVYLDFNRNLKEYRPNNMDRIRADWSIRYRLFN